MLELTDTQIGTWVATFILPLFRVTALLMTMPIFGTRMLPARIRLYAALAITVVIVPGLPPLPEIDPLSLRGVLLCGEQIIVGVLFGLSLQMLFQAFVVAGQIIAVQMGMAFASMVDPANGVNVAVVSQFMTMLVSILFLVMNGHLVVFEVLTESFTTLPVGNALVVGHFWEMAGRLSWVLGAGLLLILPAIAALLVVNIAFGVMTRAAPQLNIFSIGFPLTLVLGMGIFWVGLADILSHYQALASEALQWLRELARAR
ncbi:flagellar type III secretion system protein FliR [Pseudomonas guariconensis]|uniref:flagellar biosynthetic protein FliR n=1 Tax=Pseudomonas TaxID=286 RepID=UPI001CE49D28|nr:MULTISPECIES: flagellar biosynthetic protein FliR [Pseudomonas]MCO7643037.1 flagellar type III secretion system protein FliR [Pseudomonas sp. S 311-6]MCO7516178.1 flagellar type III secretion system protein FliR [Pseudomonas putida]MCO7567698.1 flagellar type III secretion system protein FliR [Pseudomonas mosselii]MCO7595857.1 flagellar type III secretion system protein FliR [Pseudomonas guariconensis]MCO7606028.1 flagellar type III secretion system protein FliR [Pseudomonas guariconensis]